VVCLVGGFFFGRTTAPGPSMEELLVLDSLEQQRDALTRERDDLKDKVADLTLKNEALVVNMGELKTLASRLVEERSSRDSTDVDSTPDVVDAPGDDAEEPDPEKAAELVVQIKDALADGEAETLEQLIPELTPQKEFLVPELVTMLEEADSLFAKENLSRLLGAMEDPRALPALQSLLQSEQDDGVRTAAIRALAKIPDPSSIPLLEAEFSRESSSPMPPSVAATSLGSIGTPDAIAALKKEIGQGSNGMVRSFAMRALAGQKDASLVPFFLEQVQRTEGISEQFRKSLISAIAETGDENAIGQLQGIVYSPESSQGLKEAAKRAINKLSDEKVYDVEFRAAR
jgi:HEAT repeat protein